MYIGNILCSWNNKIVEPQFNERINNMFKEWGIIGNTQNPVNFMFNEKFEEYIKATDYSHEEKKEQIKNSKKPHKEKEEQIEGFKYPYKNEKRDRFDSIGDIMQEAVSSLIGMEYDPYDGWNRIFQEPTEEIAHQARELYKAIHEFIHLYNDLFVESTESYIEDVNVGFRRLEKNKECVYILDRVFGNKILSKSKLRNTIFKYWFFNEEIDNPKNPDLDDDKNRIDPYAARIYVGNKELGKNRERPRFFRFCIPEFDRYYQLKPTKTGMFTLKDEEETEKPIIQDKEENT
jgi:hypothetical protein